MPHTSTSIYKNSSYGISIADIAAVIGTGGDLGYIITHYDINKWAKFKPLRDDTTGILSTTRRKELNQGLSTTVATSTGEPTTSGSFFNKLLAGTLPWDYNKPRGYHVNGTSTNEWFRMQDLDGYSTQATAPIEPFSLSQIMLTYNNELVLQWESNERESYDIALSDLRMENTDFADWYLGVLLYDSSRGVYEYAAPVKAGSNSLSITFSSMSSWAGKTVKMVPFLSTVQLTQAGQASSNGKYVSLFGFEPVNLTITLPTSGVYVYFNQNMWNSTNTGIDYEIEINNTNTSPRSGLNLVVTIVEGSQAATGSTIATRTFSNYSIAANTSDSTTVKGTFSNLTRDPNQMYWITIVSSGSTVITYQYNAIEDYEPDEPLEE